jgi:hypothetical protein
VPPAVPATPGDPAAPADPVEPVTRPSSSVTPLIASVFLVTMNKRVVF